MNQKLVDIGARAIDQRLGHSEPMIDSWFLSAAVLKAITEAGYAIVPREPTEEMWGGLARVIMRAFAMEDKTPRKLFRHIERSFGEVPQWLRDEGEMQALDHVISKGTRCVIIYKAMIESGEV